MTTSPIDLTEEDGKCRNSKWSKSTMRLDCASVYLKSGIPKRQKTEIRCIHYRRRYSVVICKLNQRLENTVLFCLVVWYTLDYSVIEDRGWMEVELSKAKRVLFCCGHHNLHRRTISVIRRGTILLVYNVQYKYLFLQLYIYILEKEMEHIWKF